MTEIWSEIEGLDDSYRVFQTLGPQSARRHRRGAGVAMILPTLAPALLLRNISNDDVQVVFVKSLRIVTVGAYLSPKCGEHAREKFIRSVTNAFLEVRTFYII